ncbi:MAG: tyrosine-type recombinase/integrase [Planctomycetes bacterium]|nr:tyrosine-type recombinase/integrase [Planctomycetota bacterium]
MTKRSKKRRSRKVKSDRAKKPYPDFPLTAHPSGKWCKSIRGKLFYFGNWARREKGKLVRVPEDGWQEALDEYKEQAEALHAGRTPRPNSDELTVADLCNRFLTSKQRLLDNGEIVPRTFQGYKAGTDRLVAFFGPRLVDDLATNDFGRLRSEIAKTCGPVRLGNEIQGVRSVFKFGFDEGLIEKPIRYGQQFKKPSLKTLRKNRSTNGKRMFEAAEIRKILDSASQPLRTMILLGINCGFGNTDVSSLPQSAVDLDNGWVDYPRPKTGIERRCPLWRETVEALRGSLERQPRAKDDSDDDLCFITKYGHRWVKTNRRGTPDDAVGKEFAKLLKELDLKRPGVSFYALRHTFQTIGEEAGETATRHIMGHVDDSMSAVYRERISDERLKAVTDHVHSWLWPESHGDGDQNTQEIRLKSVG